MVFENIIAMFGNLWELLTEFLLIIMFIILTALFFVVEYVLLRAYVWVFKRLWNFPLTEIVVHYIIENVLGVKVNSRFKKYLPSSEKQIENSN